MMLEVGLKGNLSDWKEAQWGNGVLLECRLHRYVFFKTTHCAVCLRCELFFHEKFKKLIRIPSEEAALSYPWPSIASHHQQRDFPTGVMNRVERQARFGPVKTLASRRHVLQAQCRRYQKSWTYTPSSPGATPKKNRYELQKKKNNVRAHSHPTLCNPMNYSPLGSSVHGIFSARMLEWVAISSSRDLPDPGIEPMSLGSLPLSHREALKIMIAYMYWSTKTEGRTKTLALQDSKLSQCYTEWHSLNSNLE